MDLNSIRILGVQSPYIGSTSWPKYSLFRYVDPSLGQGLGYASCSMASRGGGGLQGMRVGGLLGLCF